MTWIGKLLMMGLFLGWVAGPSWAGQGLKDLTPEEFEAEVVKGTGPALVLFWSGGGWNSYERVFGELYEALAREYGASVRFSRFNITPVLAAAQSQDPMKLLLDRYDVPILPTTIMYRDGRPVDRLRGGFNDRSLWPKWEQGMREWIESNLTKPNGQWVLRLEGHPEPTRVPLGKAKQPEGSPGQAPKFGGPEPLFKIIPAPK